MRHPLFECLRWFADAPGRGLFALALIFGAVFTTHSALAEEADSIRGPDVTIIAEEERNIFEYRQNGVLRMIRVVPNWGKPYYLVPRDQTQGYDDLERAETLLPSWVIVEF